MMEMPLLDYTPRTYIHCKCMFLCAMWRTKELFFLITCTDDFQTHFREPYLLLQYKHAYADERTELFRAKLLTGNDESISGKLKGNPRILHASLKLIWLFTHRGSCQEVCFRRSKTLRSHRFTSPVKHKSTLELRAAKAQKHTVIAGWTTTVSMEMV